MEQLISGLVKQVGLDDEMARKVVDYLKENADSLPGWLASGDLAKTIADKLPGGLGGLLGG